MTTALNAREVASRIVKNFANALAEVTDSAILVKSEQLLPVAGFLKNDPELDFDYLANLTAVDYLDYFEVVYHLTSIRHNHSLILKTRAYNRENPTVPSVTSLWRGADFQEREAYDLMGISFSGHPNLKRLLLWEGFLGHPLRRDYL